jgi:threonine dehydratase
LAHQGQLNDLAAAALHAYKRIRWHVRETPLLPSQWLSAVGKCHAYLKLESEQHTNSFKARGAVNKVFCFYSSTPFVTG